MYRVYVTPWGVGSAHHGGTDLLEGKTLELQPAVYVELMDGGVGGCMVEGERKRLTG